MLQPTVRSYVTRENWPLYNRVNDIIQQIVEAGLIKKAQDEIILKIERERGRRAALTKKSFKVISLKQLKFTFYVLALGYICAIIIFVLELAIGGSIPVCQNRKVVEKKEEKNTRKKDKSRTNGKLSIFQLKTD